MKNLEKSWETSQKHESSLKDIENMKTTGLQMSTGNWDPCCLRIKIPTITRGNRPRAHHDSLIDVFHQVFQGMMIYHDLSSLREIAEPQELNLITISSLHQFLLTSVAGGYPKPQVAEGLVGPVRPRSVPGTDTHQRLEVF